MKGQEQASRHANRVGWACIAPALTAIAIFYLYPLLRTFLMSFFDLQRTTTLRPELFLGLEAYRDLLANPLFWRSVGFTLAFALSAVFLELAGGLVLALIAVGLAPRWRRRLLATWILPWAVPPIVFAAIWRWSLRPESGFFSVWIPEPGALLSSPGSAMATVILAQASRGVWMVGLFMVAAIVSLPPEVHDAAATDGASPSRRFRTVTMPLLAPAIASIGALRLLDGLRVFEMVYGLTGGGPGAATEVLSSHAYRHYFSFLDFGAGSAYAVASLILVTATAALYFILTYRRDS